MSSGKPRPRPQSRRRPSTILWATVDRNETGELNPDVELRTNVPAKRIRDHIIGEAIVWEGQELVFSPCRYDFERTLGIEMDPNKPIKLRLTVLPGGF